MRAAFSTTVAIFVGSVIGISGAYTFDAAVLGSNRHLSSVFFIPGSIPPSLVVRGVIRSVDDDTKTIEFESVSPYDSSATISLRVSFNDSTNINMVDKNSKSSKIPPRLFSAMLSERKGTVSAGMRIMRRDGPFFATTIIGSFEQI